MRGHEGYIPRTCYPCFLSRTRHAVYVEKRGLDLIYSFLLPWLRRYALYGSGRKNCRRMTVFATLPERHNLVKVAQTFMAPNEPDVIEITVEMNPEAFQGTPPLAADISQFEPTLPFKNPRYLLIRYVHLPRVFFHPHTVVHFCECCAT